MTFDPEQLPLADLGLMCRDCGYPLAGLTQLTCPECGKAIDLAAYLPDGAMPTLYHNGGPVRVTDELTELLDRYHLPWAALTTTWDMMPGMKLGRAREGGSLTVPRDRYFEALDLLRRLQCDEAMPPPPPPPDPADDWACPTCGEANPSSFELCWNCPPPEVDPPGSSPPGSSPPGS